MTIKGSEWTKQVESLSRAAVMTSVIEQVKKGHYLRWPMIEIQVGQISLAVASDVFAIGTEEDLVRVPLAAPTAPRVADLPTCMLPTRQISDLIWQQAACRLAPRPMGPPEFGYNSSMMSVHRFELHSHWIDEQLRDAGHRAGELVAGHKKDVVVSNRLMEHPGRVAIYGWHRIVHEDTYYDYSHGIRLICQDAHVDGQSTSLLKLLADPEISRLLSKEGPLKVGVYALNPIEPITIPSTISRYRSNDPKVVKQWQSIIKATADGIFGAITELTTRIWQQDHGLQADGIVGPMTWRKALGVDPASPAPSKEEIRFVQAKHYRPIAGTPRQIDYLIIHTMEAAEHPQTAENVASWFARGCPDANGKERRASAHYNIDENSAVQSVLEKDVAFCAPGTNHNGIHLEHAGYSRQTDEEWQDVYSQGMLARSARLATYICQRYSIPVEFIPWQKLLEGKRGITYHREVSKACRYAQQKGLRDSPFFNHHSNRPKTDHGDPGSHFPIKEYLQMIQDHMPTASQPE
jgi:peptidoglycan hydrolase-like protein with peptidoglycan-binding domain